MGMPALAEMMAQSEPVNEGEHAAEDLEEKARKALECPCVADLRDGPCGMEFSTAFVCFVKSERPEKGSDCERQFVKMQECMVAHANSFISASTPLDTSVLQTPESRERSPGSEDADNSDSDDEDSHPPKVPPKSIRLPSWFQKADV